MRARYTERFRRSYDRAPLSIQRAFAKQLRFLLADLRHPSLHAKKYDTGRDIWQARITRGWRFYFLIDGEAFVLLDLIAHPK